MKHKAASHILTVLMLGIVSQVGQVVLVRELLMVFQGSELSIGIILASWLAWVGIGSRLGGVLAERVRSPASLLLLSTSGVVLILPLTILLIRGLRGFLGVMPGAYLSVWDMIYSCFALMAPACLLIGFQFVLLARIWRERDGVEDTSGAGKTYVGEAFGNMAGGAAFTFLLVHRLNSLQAAVLVAGLMLAGALLTSPQSYKARRLFLLILAVAILSLPYLSDLDDWAYSLKWRSLMPQHHLIEVHQSKHGAISVLKKEDQYSFFQSGHLVFTTAGSQVEAPGLEDQEAVAFAHFSLVQHPAPRRVLLIGGGLRGVLRETLKHPVKRVDYVELDDVLIEAALPHVSAHTRQALADPRVNMIHADGRLFVKAAQDRYEVILVDVPDPATSVLNRYYTVEFFREAEGLLEPGGVLAIGALSTPDLRGRAIANRNATIYHTLKTVFDHVMPAGDRFMIYLASNSPQQVSLDIPTLEKRYRNRGIEADGFSAHHFHTMLPQGQLERVNWVVRNHGRSSTAHLEGPGLVPLFPGTVKDQLQAEDTLPPVNQRYFINSDSRPVLYFHTLMFWDRLTRVEGDSFGWILHIRSWWAACLVLGLLILALFFRSGLSVSGKSLGVRFSVLFTVFTTGFSTMMLQVAIIFSFQSIYGFVYEVVGLIVAVFMGGLALGAMASQLWIKDNSSIDSLAGIQLAIALLASLVAVFLPTAAGFESSVAILLVFGFITFVSGLINGVDFPISAACYLALSGRPDRTSGTVYGVELSGACVGASLASIVVVPVFGIATACLLAALANGTAFVVLVLHRGSYLCMRGRDPESSSAGGTS